VQRLTINRLSGRSVLTFTQPSRQPLPILFLRGGGKKCEISRERIGWSTSNLVWASKLKRITTGSTSGGLRASNASQLSTFSNCYSHMLCRLLLPLMCADVMRASDRGEEVWSTCSLRTDASDRDQHERLAANTHQRDHVWIWAFPTWPPPRQLYYIRSLYRYRLVRLKATSRLFIN